MERRVIFETGIECPDKKYHKAQIDTNYEQINILIPFSTKGACNVCEISFITIIQ